MMNRTPLAQLPGVASGSPDAHRANVVPDVAARRDTVDGGATWSESPELSPGAIALLNAIASVAPATTDPWARFPPVLAVEHVAEIMGMKVGSAREAARRGNLPMTRRLGRYVVDQVTFRRWLAGYDVWAEGLVPGAGATGV
jgi:hypothetical protein